MSAPQIMIPRQTLDSGWIVLHMPSSVGWSNYSEVREAMCDGMHACVHEHRSGMVVDLTATALDDSSALVLLIRAGTRAGLLRFPIRLVVPNVSVQLRQALRNLGITPALPVFPSVHAAVSAALPSTPPADPAVLQHALYALQSLHLTANEPGSPLGPAAELLPNGDSINQDLLIKVTSPEVKPLRLELGGKLTYSNIGHLGNVLSSFVDRSLHHLRIESWPAVGHAGVLPVLLGIRWRVTPAGGCLQLPSPPEWLRHLLHREGIQQTFTSCTACARRAGDRLAVLLPLNAGHPLGAAVHLARAEPYRGPAVRAAEPEEVSPRRTSAIDVTSAVSTFEPPGDLVDADAP